MNSRKHFHTAIMVLMGISLCLWQLPEQNLTDCLIQLLILDITIPLISSAVLITAMEIRRAIHKRI